MVDALTAFEPGETTFMGLRLWVSTGTLVPRPETELLAANAIELLRTLSDPRAIDMCCGVGNLAVVVGSQIPTARIWASDLTDPCVTTTRRNVAAYGLDSRVSVLQGDLFAPLAGLGLEGTIDAIVCNPPYISSGRLAGDNAHLLINEPREAFDAGPYGLTIHQRVVREGFAFLRPGGHLLMEFGVGQSRQVRLVLERSGRFGNLRFARDSSGQERVVVVERLAGG